jgi:mRNA interferase HigB
MRVVGREKIQKFSRKHAIVRPALESWFADVRNAQWQKPQDIKNRYRSADFLANDRVIFNIKGNRYRLVIKVRYKQGIVLIEWIGTHAEYSKKQF